MAYSQDALERQLQAVRDKKAQRDTYMKAPTSYRDFTPASLGYTPRDTAMAYDNLNEIAKQGTLATERTNTEVANEQAYNMMLEQKAAAARAARLLKLAKKPPKIKVTPETHNIRVPNRNQPRNNGGGGNHTLPGGGTKPPKGYTAGPGGIGYGTPVNNDPRWGKDHIPEVSDIGTLQPHAKIITVNWKGHSFGINSQVAPIFTAFLDDLYATGYRPYSIGGYNKRNIAGTSTPSLHSYGFAIDINPAQNPVTYGGQGAVKTNMPPNIKSLAAKYGLSWGGDWNGSKQDPMHFSIAYGGTK